MICYFYAQRWEEAIANLPPAAELVYTGDTDHSYWEAVKARWGQELVAVEHDVRLHATVLEQFNACSSMWCGFRTDAGVITLGCTRFRAGIAVTVEDILAAEGPLPQHKRSCDTCGNSICWRHLDKSIWFAMASHGYTICEHGPRVRHLSTQEPSRWT